MNNILLNLDGTYTSVENGVLKGTYEGKEDINFTRELELAKVKGEIAKIKLRLDEVEKLNRKLNGRIDVLEKRNISRPIDPWKIIH